MDKIAFPTDFSEASLTALAKAPQYVTPFCPSELHLITVLEEVIPAAVQCEVGLSLVDPAVMMDEAEQSAWERLNGMPVTNPGTAAVVRAVLRTPDGVATEIVRYAEQQGIDLIVLGTHGRTGLKHLVSGSVTESIIRAAPCPVLVLPPRLSIQQGASTE